MSGPQIVAPDPNAGNTGPIWATAQRLETLIKLLGAALALVLALGTPAVVFQYKGIGLPLQFITHEEVIRAGMLPSMTIGVVFGLAYLAFGRLIKTTTSSQIDPQRTILILTSGALIFNLTAGWSLFTEYLLRKLHLEYEPTFRASLHVGWKVRLILTITAVGFVATGIYAAKAARRLCHCVNTPNGYWWANLGIALSWGLSLLLNSVAQRVVMPGTAVEPFLNALEAALFLALCMILFSLAADLRSRDSVDERKTVIRQLVFVIFFAYCCAVLFYSLSWYRLIPHYLGGGEPVPVTIWVAKGSVADPLLLGCAAANADFARCEHLYLISVDTDYYILSLDATPSSRGVVLPRQAVGLISGGVVGSK